MKPCKNIEDFFQKINLIGGDMRKSSNLLFNEISKELGSTQAHIYQQLETLKDQFDVFKKAVFKQLALEKVKKLVGNYDFEKEQLANLEGSGVNEKLLSLKISYVGGVIDTEYIMQFKKLLIRATRCKVYIHSQEIELRNEDKIIDDPYDKKKSVFVIAFQETAYILDKIDRVCNSFSQLSFPIDIETLPVKLNEIM